MTEPIEDVDYAVDYYAVIGVPRDADDGAIAAAIKRQRVLNHTDRYETLAPWARQRADAEMRLLARAEERLTDPVKRARQDELLASGLPVSADGTPIIVPGRGSFTLRALAGEDIEGTLAAELEQAVRTYGGADPDYIAELEERIAAAPERDPVLLARYAKALERQEMELVAEEVLLRLTMGLDASDRRPATVAGHLEAASSLVDEGRARLDGQLGQVAGLLEGGARLALPAGEGDGEPVTLDRAEVEERAGLVAARYDALGERVRENAARRAVLMEKRLDLLALDYAGGRRDGRRLVVAFESGEGSRLALAFRLVGTSVEPDPSVREADLARCTEPAVAARLRRRGISVATFRLDGDLPWRDQVERLVTGHFERLLNPPERTAPGAEGPGAA